MKSSKTASSSASSSKKETDIEKEPEREGFSNGIEFVLTCMGLAVGLGNIWRFPYVAYSNGGSAFLIPYLTCAILFGLPAIYMEFLLGQYNGVSPPVIFRRIMPILEGVGWMGPMVSACVAIYYIVIISWISMFLVNIMRGDHKVWMKCDNSWNDPATCIDMELTKGCVGIVPSNWNEPGEPPKSVFVNGTCQVALKEMHAVTATEQYFTANIISPSTGMYDFQGINWYVFGAMTFCWILTCLFILKGMKIMGKISYVTVILPYIIVVILFIRGITLDGASDGINYYLGQPKFDKILMHQTWVAALKQLCFSLSLGHGGLMSMASYSKKRNNCFRDACIVVGGDTAMSLVGGAAVFSTLGFLAKQRGVAVPDVVDSGMTLAFVVYPEAMAQMPFPVVWCLLFFIMLFLLGISTEIALVEVFCSCLYDQFKSLRTKKYIVASLWCFTLYTTGLIFSTKAGLYWFEMFDEYAAGFSSVFTVFIELLVLMYIYGRSNFSADILATLGEARNSCTAFFGPLSPYFVINWMVISPIMSIVLIGLSFIREYPFMGEAHVYPPVFDILGWFVAFLPVIMVPLFAIINIIRHSCGSIGPLFEMEKEHASYNRIHHRTGKSLKELTALEESDKPTVLDEGASADDQSVQSTNEQQYV